MTSIDCARFASSEARRRCEQRHARLIFGVAYPLCLAFAVGARLTPRAWRSATGVFDGRRSVFGEAKAAAQSCIPFAIR